MKANILSRYSSEFSNPILTGITLNIISTVLMSFAPIINKFALGSISPLSGALLCAMFGTLFCLLFSIVSRKPILAPKGPIIIVISLLNGIAILCLFSAQSLLNPMIVGFMGRFYIVFTTLLSIFFLRERASRTEWLLIGVAVLSTFLLNYKGLSSSATVGVSLIIVQTFLFALVNTLIKKHLKDFDSNSILFFNNLISSLFIFCYILTTSRAADLAQVTIQGSLWMFLSAFLSSFFGIFLFYKGLKFLSFSEANLIRATAPIFTAAFSALFFPIPLMNFMNVFGAVVLVVSIIALAAVKMAPVIK